MATKTVTVTEEGDVLVVKPAVIRLKSGRDRMKVHNRTTRDLVWNVPPEIFTEFGRYIEGIRRGKDSQDPKAITVEARVEKEYTLTEARTRSGKRRRKAQAKSDPVIIIDL